VKTDVNSVRPEPITFGNGRLPGEGAPAVGELRFGSKVPLEGRRCRRPDYFWRDRNQGRLQVPDHHLRSHRAGGATPPAGSGRYTQNLGHRASRQAPDGGPRELDSRDALHLQWMINQPGTYERDIVGGTSASYDPRGRRRRRDDQR
jgi:hypothetical protein